MSDELDKLVRQAKIGMRALVDEATGFQEHRPSDMTPVGTQRWATYIDFAEAWEYLRLPAEPTGSEANLLKRTICAGAMQRWVATRATTPRLARSRRLRPDAF